MVLTKVTDVRFKVATHGGFPSPSCEPEVFLFLHLVAMLLQQQQQQLANEDMQIKTADVEAELKRQEF